MSDYWTDPKSEATCERCGGKNPIWFVDSDRFNASVAALGLTRAVVICPGCFQEGHERATGMRCSWQLVTATPLRWLTDDEKPSWEEE